MPLTFLSKRTIYAKETVDSKVLNNLEIRGNIPFSALYHNASNKQPFLLNASFKLLK